jgi:beta-galactosidase
MTAGRGFFVGELQSGYGIHGTTVGSPVTAGDLEMWTWGMVSRGARAINYYAFYPMNAGYESGGYGMINLDGSLTERSRHAGEIAKQIAVNADLLLDARPEPAEAAVVFSPLAPLVGGYDEEGSRTAMHQAVAGYHRMFFERNLRLDVLSARELAVDHLERYKLVIVPYPLMLTDEEAAALRAYAEGGGHLFMEARPGWVDERGHAQMRVPGFGWDQMLGVREKQVTPGKEFQVTWGTATFKAMTFAEQFETEKTQARPVATLEDGTPVAYESKVGKGSAILFGSFAGQENYRDPVKMHPLGDILANWAGLSRPRLTAPPLVELRELRAPQGRMVFLFNHGDATAQVRFTRDLEQPARAIRCITSGAALPGSGSKVSLETEVPPGTVRVYRIDY